MELLTGSDLVVAAKNIRKELKAAYPSVAFSVRSSRYSGGCSIDVGWTDGPTTKEVDAIIQKYKAGDFDGMTDCYNYSRSAFNENHGSAKFIFGKREYSDAFVLAAIGAVTAKYAPGEVLSLADYREGKLYGRGPSGLCNYPHTWQEYINRHCSETAC